MTSKSNRRRGPCLRFLDLEKPERPTTSYVQRRYVGTPSQTNSERTTKQSDQKISYSKKNRGKAGSTDAIKRDETPVEHTNLIKRFGIINVGEHSTITEEGKQQEHAGKRHPAATTTNKKIGSAKAINSRWGSGKPGPDKGNRKPGAINNEEIFN